MSMRLAFAGVCSVRYTVVRPMFSLRWRSSPFSSWAERNPSTVSSRSMMAPRCRWRAPAPVARHRYRKPFPVAISRAMTHVKARGSGRPKLMRFGPKAMGATHRGVRHRFNRQPGKASWPGVPVRRDLRRHPVGLGLRAARCGAQENIKRQWWKSVVTGRRRRGPGLLDHPAARGVVARSRRGFHDPLVECLNCHKRHRQDHLQEAHAEKKNIADPESVPMTEIVCPDCGTKGQWTEPREFNMMLKTYLGPIEERGGLHYLRPGDRTGHLRQLRQRGDHLAA